MPIHILPDHIASQIAAGEVVERPASVVKELIENAIDASATSIQVTIEGSGQRLIVVSDDGAGIPANEVALALARYATSKLQTTEDLFAISTLGFRGEALASIGSVARLTLTSFNGIDTSGSRIRMEGGRPENLVPVGVPKGSVVRVEDLFYNVPARLKFLKSESTEKGQIQTLITRYALAYPVIRWEYIQDGLSKLRTSGNGDKREVLNGLMGVADARKMIDVEFEENSARITGYISPVALTRSNRKDIIIFVNGRWVQDVSVSSAVVKAYHTMLMVGRFPIAMLFIEIPPTLVDVNVHPAKAEVRFREELGIFNLVQRAVRRALLSSSPAPMLHLNPNWGTQTRQVDPAWQMSGEPLPELDQVTGQTQPVIHSQVELPGNHLPLLRLVGQVANTYLVAEGPDGLYLIDQHAAHERVLFEQLMAQFTAKSIPSQTLADPPIIQLPGDKAAKLIEQASSLKALGFDLDDFGPDTFILRAIPSILMKGDPRAAVTVLVDTFEEDETPLQSEVEARIAARVCKRMAVKGGQRLSESEQKALLMDLENCDSPRTCPHGRPTMIHLPADLLERQFGRTGAR